MKVNLIYTLVSLHLSKDLHITFSIGFSLEMNNEVFLITTIIRLEEGVCLSYSVTPLDQTPMCRRHIIAKLDPTLKRHMSRTDWMDVDIISKLHGQHNWERSCDCFNIDERFPHWLLITFASRPRFWDSKWRSSRLESARRMTRFSTPMSGHKSLCAELVVPEHKTTCLRRVFFFFLIHSHTLTPRHDQCDVGCVWECWVCKRV